jgi:hypothetical protein
MKYWEVIADKLHASGWSWGYCSAVTRDGWRWIVDAHREGRRYIVRSDELLSARQVLAPAPFQATATQLIGRIKRHFPARSTGRAESDADQELVKQRE